jgi:hypothetical protein
MTMKVSEALTILGTKRVIWIDDRFNKTTPAQLAQLLTNHLEVSKECAFVDIGDAFLVYEIDPANGAQLLEQRLTDLPHERFLEIESLFRDKEGMKKLFPTNELSSTLIARACELMGITEEDRWTFERADSELLSLCSKGDSDLGYVVDLNDAGGSAKRGLDALRILWRGQSRGTAFILTHETDTAREGETEAGLRNELAEEGEFGLPICVIAKERIADHADDEDHLTEAFTIGVKRAGLRRSMYDVLVDARVKLKDAIDTAAKHLLAVSPEQLDQYVFERGYKEGVSELHVVERAITAYVGKEARAFFGTDAGVHASARRLRALRTIPLQFVASDPDPYLQEFREAETWETDELLNRALTPIACGDVFELDREEVATKASKQKFVLLGQPCDISLRPEEKKRAQETGFLVPLRTKTTANGNVDAKAPLLPFTLKGEQWACDFRTASIARLAILDLASIRPDGRVRFDKAQIAPAELLVAQQKVYAFWADLTKEPIEHSGASSQGQIKDLNLQLTFSSTEAFKNVYLPQAYDATSTKAYGVTTERPRRLTWHLRRCGRIRMPYAAVMLDQYTTVMSRHAFDLDYMSPGKTEILKTTVAVPPES